MVGPCRNSAIRGPSIFSSSNRNHFPQASIRVEKIQFRVSFKHMQGFGTPDMQMRPDIDVPMMHDQHFVKGVVLSGMGTQPGASTRIDRGLLLQSLDLLWTKCHQIVSGVKNLQRF